MSHARTATAIARVGGNLFARGVDNQLPSERASRARGPHLHKPWLQGQPASETPPPYPPHPPPPRPPEISRPRSRIPRDQDIPRAKAYTARQCPSSTLAPSAASACGDSVAPAATWAAPASAGRAPRRAELNVVREDEERRPTNGPRSNLF